ncbi:MAG: hypothetical protein AB1700_18840 [Bacillota bacterium]
MGVETVIVAFLFLVLAAGAALASLVVDRRLKAKAETERRAGEKLSSRRPGSRGRA